MPGLPRYEKLKALLRDKIVSGRYEKGDRFFSQNELMEKYSLSFSTVTRALDELVRDGYLVRQRGKGTFVSTTDVQQPQSESGEKRVFLFSPWTSSKSALSSSSGIFKHLQMMQPSGMGFSFVPHGDASDDLEPFLFTLEPADTAIFLYPLPQHYDFINHLAETVSVIVVAKSSFHCQGQLLITPVAEAAMDITQHLIELGHKNIAVVNDGSCDSQMSEILAGYRRALGNNDIPFSEALVPKKNENALFGSNIAQVIERYSEKEFTAVFATSSSAAVSVLSELRLMGKHAGADMSVVCYDELEKAPSVFPTVTTVSFSSSDLASRIAQLVIQTNSRTAPNSAVTLRPKLIVRSSSVACATAT